jgi:RND family efflux transporter MFP subunit
MEKEPESPGRGSRNEELEGLYKQLAQSAARLMVVHEASSILRSSHDPEELAKGLLNVVAEAVFAGSGCVASVDGEELKILAVRGLEDHEADALAENETEARVWFEVADGLEPRNAAELADTLGLSVEAEGGDGEYDEEGPNDSDWPVEDETERDAPGLEEELDGGEEREPEEPPAEGENYDDTSDDMDQEAGDGGSGPAFSLYIPLRVEDETLGVVALGNRVDGQPFGEEDERLADSLCTHLALALDHASLFAERTKRIDQLSVLLQISREITSTLDLEKVLTTICHMMGMVLPNLRTTVALTSGSTVDIRASSDPSLKGAEASKDPFLPVLRWAHGTRRRINTCLDDLKVNPEAEGGDLIVEWLGREGGPRGLAVLPLEDDQGVLGVIAIETQDDEPPVDDDTDELVTVLANQTTVAIRNAELYQRVPMIGMLEPVFGRAKSGVSGRRRLLLRGGIVAALLAIGLFLPLPSWVSGDASVRPAVPVPLRAATEGTVEEVFVSEGERVSSGTLLARLRSDELELELEQVRAASQGARVEAARARSQGDLATFRAQQAEINELFEREKFLLSEIDRTDLVAPIDGLVLTKDVELRRGERLSRGETFLDLADLSMMEVEVDVQEKNVDRVFTGRSARLKVHAYPGRTFRGQIVRVAPRASAGGTFRVTVRLSNEDGALRPGMTGRAHLDTPNRPILRAVLDPVVHRLRIKFWM